VMSAPEVIHMCLCIVGGALLAVGHAQGIPAPYGQIAGEVGAAMLLYAQRRPGDVPIATLPASVRESMKPPPAIK
jgi:hypothetical protein